MHQTSQGRLHRPRCVWRRRRFRCAPPPALRLTRPLPLPAPLPKVRFVAFMVGRRRRHQQPVPREAEEVEGELGGLRSRERDAASGEGAP